MSLNEKQEPKTPDLNRPNLNEQAAAYYLGLSVSSLRKSRMNGKRDNHLPPPPFHKLGRRVIYIKEELQAYLSRHCSHQFEGS